MLDEFVAGDLEGVGAVEVEAQLGIGDGVAASAGGCREAVEEGIAMQIEVDSADVGCSRYSLIIIEDFRDDARKDLDTQFSGGEMQDGDYVPFLFDGFGLGQSIA